MPRIGTSLAGLAAVLVLALGAVRLGPATARAAASEVDLRSLTPGRRVTTALGRWTLEVSVPAGEGVTGGTLRVALSPNGFDSGLVPRAGSPETAWIADINADEVPDAVLVIRGGGSGSYASILVLESLGEGYVLMELPQTSPAPGYMGHDVVTVRDGRVVRSIPTYVDRPSLRMDRQWTPGRGLEGRAPIRKRPDTNASPSGETQELWFDLASQRWRTSP